MAFLARYISTLILLDLNLCFLLIDGLHGEQCTKENYERDFPCWLSEFLDFRAGRKCVRFVMEQRLQYAQASQRCHSYGGELLEIHSQAEDVALSRQHDFLDYLNRNEFWLGLHMVRESGPEFHWNNDSELARWMSWAPGHPASLGAGDMCVYRATSGLWKAATCDSQHNYICQTYSGRAPRPLTRLEVTMHEPPGVMVGGQIATFYCSAFVGQTGRVHVEFLDKSLSQVEPALTLYDMDSQDRQYKMDGIRCGLHRDVTLKARISQGHNRKTAQCCVTGPQCDVPQCGGDASIVVRWNPTTPTVTADYTRTFKTKLTMEAHCTAHVGTAGKMSWVLEDVSTTTMWVVAHSGLVTKHGTHVASVHGLPAEMDERGGPRLSSNFTLLVGRSQYDKMLYCASGDTYLEGFDQQEFMTGISIVADLYQPQDPILELVQTDKARGVTQGDLLQFSCSAYVGTRGALSWLLETASGLHRWTISDEHGAHFRDMSPNVMITFSRDRRDKEMGPMINSTLTLLAKDGMNGSRVECYSYDIAKTVGGGPFDLYNDMVGRWVRAIVIVMKPLLSAINANSEKPTLHVYFHEVPSVAFLNRYLTARCTTPALRDSKMTWTLNGRDLRYDWSVDIFGVILPVYEEPGINVTYDKETSDPSRRFIATEITLKINERMDKMELICTSYDVRNVPINKKETLTASHSPLFTVLDDPLEEGLGSYYLRQALCAGVGFITIASVLVSVLMILQERRKRALGPTSIRF